MDSKDAAVRAIIATHGAQIEGYTVKCSWGKEMSESSQNQQSSSSSAGQNQVPPPQSVRISRTLLRHRFLTVSYNFLADPGFLAVSRQVT